MDLYRLIVTSLAALVLSGCASRLTVRRATETMKGNGIYYMLPRTVVQSEITLSRASFVPGLYADTVFARIKYPTEELEVKPSLKFAVDAASLDHRAEPDNTRTYFIEVPWREWLPFRTRAIETTTTDSGLLSRASVEVTDSTLETTIAAIGAGASIASKISSKFGLQIWEIADRECKGWTGRDLKACQVYEEIRRLRKSREELISGRSSPALSGNAFESMLKALTDEIEGRENLYFKGVKTTKKELRKFDFTPAHGSLKYDLFTYSETRGVCEHKDSTNSAKPFPPNFSNKKATNEELSRKKEEIEKQYLTAGNNLAEAQKKEVKSREAFTSGCKAFCLTEDGELEPQTPAPTSEESVKCRTLFAGLLKHASKPRHCRRDLCASKAG